MLGFISFIYFYLDKDVAKELVKVQELIKANIQRSKVIQDQVIIKRLKNVVTVWMSFLGFWGERELTEYIWAQAENSRHNSEVPE